MSEIGILETGEEVHYFLDDTEFVLDPSHMKSEELNDIIFADGTRAVFVNGNVLPGDAQTVVLQDGEELNQFYINDETGQFLIANEQDSTSENILEAPNVIQYVNEDDTSQEPQVVYVNEEGFTLQEEDFSNYEIAEVQGGESNFPLKTIKLLDNQVVDLEELIRQQGVVDSDSSGYQYAILKDGKLHIQTYNPDENLTTLADENPLEMQENSEIQESEQISDLSKITGRNLLTGQTVTLHSYMDKIQKKIKENTNEVNGVIDISGRKRKHNSLTGLTNLINKKIPLGKTNKGKTLVGKIINVTKKDESEIPEKIQKDNEDQSVSTVVVQNISESNINDPLEGTAENNVEEIRDVQSDMLAPVENATDNQNTNSVISLEEIRHMDQKKIRIHEKIVSKECFLLVSRSLAGLMNMESVKKKLQYKNIIVKVVEKTHNEKDVAFSKKVSYSSGWMTEEYIVNENDEMLENWKFIPDNKTKEAIFGLDDDNASDDSNKYADTTNVTVMITQEKTGERVVRVILNPTTGNKCGICSTKFRSALQLRVHKNVHTRLETLRCDICSMNFKDKRAMQEHNEKHVDDKAFECEVCSKKFLTSARLRRHMNLHFSKPLECSLCLHACSSESVLRRHMLSHMDVKPHHCEVCGMSFSNQGDLNFHKRTHNPLKCFACKICGRTFSRYSNLQRHVEIHKGAGALYRCVICGCSYHYISSLTRHVVQNHVTLPVRESNDPVVEETMEEQTQIDMNVLEELTAADLSEQ